MPQVDEEGESILVCAGCGMEIFPIEVMGEFDGRFVDYEVHLQGIANFIFCADCWNKIKENLETPPHVARERRQRLIEEINVNRSTE